MNTNRRNILMVLLCLQFTGVILSQQTYQVGLLPSINLNSKLKKNWSLNSKLESRQLLRRGLWNDSVLENYNYVLTDLSLVTAKKVGLNGKIAGGYLIRLENGEVIHRIIQQYTTVQSKSGYRLAHRFLADQTISSIERPTFRLRYRLTAEIPLNGESVDMKEFYVKLNNEYVNSVQANVYDLEIRLIPLLGYGINDHHKIELGLDYRVNSLFNNNPRQSFWTTVNWYIEM